MRIVIPMNKWPRWMFFSCGFFFVFSMVLAALHIACPSESPPDSFAIDSSERVYLARSDGVHVYEREQEIACYPLREASAMLSISADDVLTVCEGHRITEIDLTQSDLAANAFHIVRQEDMESRSEYYAQRKLRHRCTQNGVAYRLESPWLRYRIVRETNEGDTVLYRMPARDYLFLWLRAALILGFLVYLVLALTWIWRYVKQHAA